jgi:enediyne biosynthesis protein E4
MPDCRNENLLYRNNGDGTFFDITRIAGVDGRDGSGRKLWSVAAAWLDYDNDGDLVCGSPITASGSRQRCRGGLARSARTYCSPDSYRRQPNLLYRNEGRQTFKDVSLEAGVGKLVGREWVLPSHFNNDGYPDVFVAHDNARNQLFRNLANGRFEEIGIPAGVAFNGDGRHISGCRFS